MHKRHHIAKDHENSVPRAAAEVKPQESTYHSATPAQDEKNSRPQSERSAKLQWANLSLQVIIAVITAAILWVYYGQLRAMVASNELTRQSNLLTRVSNESSDRTSKRTQQLMEESNRLTRKALETSTRQAEANRKQSASDAAAGLAMARQSLEESKRSLEVSQRARLIIDKVESSGTVVNFSPKAAMVYIKNSGAMPATAVRWTIEMLYSRSSLDLEPIVGRPKDYAYFPADQPRAALGAGQVISVAATCGGLPPPPSENKMVFIYGVLQYFDGFGNYRTSRFCQYFAGAGFITPGWQPCAIFNWLEDKTGYPKDE